MMNMLSFGISPASRLTRPTFLPSSAKRQNQSGSAIIEMALLFPLMAVMMCGTMDFARVFYAGIAVASAARAGVQLGAFSPSNAGKYDAMNAAAVADAANQGLSAITPVSRAYCGCNGSTAEVSCTTGVCGTANPNGYVETKVDYTFTPIVPYPGIPSSIVITRTARLRVQ